MGLDGAIENANKRQQQLDNVLNEREAPGAAAPQRPLAAAMAPQQVASVDSSTSDKGLVDRAAQSAIDRQRKAKHDEEKKRYKAELSSSYDYGKKPFPSPPLLNEGDDEDLHNNARMPAYAEFKGEMKKLGLGK